MIAVVKHGVILAKSDLGFENAGVLNPAAILEEDGVHLFYRAVHTGNHSTIGYCRLEDPLSPALRLDLPVLFPQADYESHGVEDPRIAKVDGLYYLTYTVYDGLNALGALATAKKLPTFEKKGVITPQVSYEHFRQLTESQHPLNEKYHRYNSVSNTNGHGDKKALVWSKNVVFFPRRINGKLHFLQRIKPDIQLVAVRELSALTPAFWDDYLLHFQQFIVMEPTHRHEISYIGAGCPPIETAHGWLLIYHGVQDTTTGYKYHACAALLDLDNPTIEIARLPYPLFSPELDYELRGEVNNVCFPTGSALFGDQLYIYYGAADERIACASVSLSGLLAELLLNANKHEK